MEMLERRGYTHEQIIKAADDLAYTTKADFGKVITLADFVEAIEPKESERLYTYAEMLIELNRMRLGHEPYTKYFTPVYIDGEAKPKWKKD